MQHQNASDILFGHFDELVDAAGGPDTILVLQKNGVVLPDLDPVGFPLVNKACLKLPRHTEMLLIEDKLAVEPGNALLDLNDRRPFQVGGQKIPAFNNAPGLNDIGDGRIVIYFGDLADAEDQVLDSNIIIGFVIADRLQLAVNGVFIPHIELMIDTGDIQLIVLPDKPLAIANRIDDHAGRFQYIPANKAHRVDIGIADLFTLRLHGRIDPRYTLDILSAVEFDAIARVDQMGIVDLLVFFPKIRPEVSGIRELL